MDRICIAILAKDKGHCLPIYLQCIEGQTYPKNKILLYIRTNNNTDNTSGILREWIEKVRDNYEEIYYDESDLPEKLERFAHHEWNYERFKALGAIRQESVDFAQRKGAHYFVVDCDNFIIPSTLSDLVKTGCDLISPLLKVHDSQYSNYHYAIDNNGYYLDHNNYLLILNREITGIIEVPVIHCTYLIRHNALKKTIFDDNTGRYEYVIACDGWRKAKINQYIDNRKDYGYITFAENSLVLKQDSVLLGILENILKMIDGTTNESIDKLMISIKGDQNNIAKTLIIAPSAGLGNRLRSIASSVAIARKLNRKLYLLWESIEPICYRQHVRDMQFFGWDKLFKPSILKANTINFPKIDKYYSEWINGDGWFDVQNVAARKWGIEPIKTRVRENVDFLKHDEEPIILIETSLSLHMENIPSKNELHQIYKELFVPNDCYMDLINKYENYDIGINIRKGDLVYYSAIANQDDECIKNWILQLSQKYKLAIFSDDLNLSTQLQEMIDQKLEINYSNLNFSEITFVNFLFLAHKCRVICGTPTSSFAEQASIFGNKPFYHNLCADIIL